MVQAHLPTRQTFMTSMSLRCLLLATVLVPALGACSVPFVSRGGDRKSECDRMSAEAIQTQNVTKARELAAGASACYAKLAQ